MQNPIVAQTQKGYSIRAQLTVIAGLSIIAAIVAAIVVMAQPFSSPDAPKVNRNAQAIVATLNAARSAGNHTSYATKEAAIAAVVAGTNGGGTFSTSLFQAPMDAAEIPAASALITGFPTASTTSLLEYNPWDLRNQRSR